MQRQVDASEADQVDRFLKRANKEPKYKGAVLELAGQIEGAVRQNNTVDVYEDHFDGYSLGAFRPRRSLQEGAGRTWGHLVVHAHERRRKLCADAVQLDIAARNEALGSV